ncbi:MAG TPA: hypothetical protein ENG87_04460, partial [Candidatus Pacearchaeota archaeon]|nr:hypothetical protein [Candidatus Pacearchaeota archaeon]
MSEARFILSKKKLVEQVKTLENLGLKVSYSYKTNRIVGNVLQDLKECEDVDYSIHAFEEIKEIRDKRKIWFFTQAESEDELEELLNLGIKNFVVDNEIDLKRLLKVIEKKRIKINLSLRMKFQEHRIGTGKYFVYGMPAVRVNEIINGVKDNEFIEKLGIHLHRKSQNTSEWEIKQEIEDSLSKENLERINMVNLGGGLPSIYRSSNVNVFSYIFGKIKETAEWLKEKQIKTIIEPGRFLAAPCVKLETEVIQKYNRNLIVNTTIYNCALDNILTGTKMLVKGEGEEGESYLIKGNSPTRDDIFRYKVKLDEKNVGDKIVFLNAGAYNYTTDFFGYKKLKTEIVEDFEEDAERYKVLNRDLKIVKVSSSQGCLRKNTGCEKFPNLVCVDGKDAEINLNDIIERNRQLENIKGDIFIRGDHSITYPLFKGMKCEGKKGLMVFDAHADCVNNFSPPTHEDFNRVLVEEGIVKPENILLIGLREVDYIERKFMDEKGIQYMLNEVEDEKI